MPELNQQIDQNKASLFPNHGWADTAYQPGTSMLWIPILRPLFDQGFSTFDAELDTDGRIIGNVRVDRGRRDNTNYAKAAYETIRKLISNLKILAELKRRVEGFTASSMQSDEARQAMTVAAELMPIHADYALVLHRRLADELFVAMGPNMFEGLGSVTKKLKVFVKQTFDWEKVKFSRDDFLVLKELGSTWLEKLRKAENGGLRDLLDHRPSSISTGFLFTSESGEAILTINPKASEPPDGARIDLLSELKTINSCFCSFSSALCRAIGVEGGYEGRRDWALVTGNCGDISEFWPAL